MKKYTLTIILLAMTASFTSCIDDRYDLNKIDKSVEIPIESENARSTTGADEIFQDFSNCTTVTESDGALFVHVAPASPVTVQSDENSELVQIDTRIKVTKEEIPESSVGINPGILVIFDNPSHSKRDLSFDVTINGKTFTAEFPEIPAESEYKVFFTNDKELPTPEDADKCYILPEEFKNLAANGFEISHISIGKVKVVKNESIAKCANNYVTYTIEAMYCSPLVYSEGQILHIERRLENLNFDFSKDIAGMSGNKFELTATITNTLPFDITGHLESDNGIYGTLNGHIKAGTPEKPEKTTVTLDLERQSEQTTSVDVITLFIDMTAKDDASLNENMSLDMKVESIKMKF